MGAGTIGGRQHAYLLAGPRAPWAARQALPGRVEAEDYRLGGEGVGYHDSDAGNAGGAYRYDDVDVQPAPGGGDAVGWTAPGEWLAYDVAVPAAGRYTIATRVGTQMGGQTLHYEVDGVAVTGPLVAPSTGGWLTFGDLVSPPVALAAGDHTLKLVFETGNVVVDAFAVAAVSPPRPSQAPTPGPSGSPPPSPAQPRSQAPVPSPSASPSPVPVPTTPTFADVPPDHWAADQITQFAARGITTGCGGDGGGKQIYCPERPVTRAEMAVFLDRTLGFPSPATPASQRFADVPPGYWAYAFIDRFAQLGITTGCGGTEFCPDRGVTRAEMAAFLIRALKQNQLAPAAPTFADVPAGHPQFGYIEALVQLGVTTGCGTDDAGRRLYCPDRGVTRAEMAVFITRAFPQR